MPAVSRRFRNWDSNRERVKELGLRVLGLEVEDYITVPMNPTNIGLAIILRAVLR